MCATGPPNVRRMDERSVKSLSTPNPPPGASSRRRYLAYLARRDEAATSRAALSPADPGPPKARPGKPSRSFMTLARAFWAMLRGHRGVVAFCALTVMISAAIGLLPPASTKVALDYVLTNNPGPAGLPDWVSRVTGTDRTTLLWIVGGGVLLATAISIVVGITGRALMTRLTKKMQAKVRRRVFEHAVRLPLHRVYQIRSGGAASILREDAGNAANLLFTLLYNPLRAVVQLVGTLAILAWVDWRLLAGSLVLIPLAYLSQKTWIARIRPVFRDSRKTREQIDAHATEAFGGMRIVRAFARQRGEAGRFVTGNHLMARQELLAWRWSRLIEIGWMIFIPLASCALLIYGGGRIFDNTMTIGDLMMFSAYLLMLLGPLESLSASATGIQSELAGLDRVLDLLGEPTEFQPGAVGATPAAAASSMTSAAAADRSSRAAVAALGRDDRDRPALTGAVLRRERVAGHVRLRDVWFAYPRMDDRPRTDGAAAGNGSVDALDNGAPSAGPAAPPGLEWVLRAVNLDVPAGATVALVGASGAGKTTLCNLVARFYDPTHGRVELDGRDLREIDVQSYRRLLGVVEQDVFLFDGSVRDNIAYARRWATRAEIEAAARAANAHEFIHRLERGYDTVIGERGVRLSGGQKQRLAIARALLADPRILILDEATSNLDSESEALIQESLRELMRGRTCFVIAHRLSTIRHADMIVVLERGEIIERGTHAQLARGEGVGRYAEMLARQSVRQE